MRNKISNENLSVLALAGTHVVTLGFDLIPTFKEQLLGFSITRQEGCTPPRYLEAIKAFKSTLPQKEAGALVSTKMHPIQDFFWSDFTVYPGQTYTYEITARGGTPSELTDLCCIQVTITTEQIDDKVKHNVFFNRGVAGSQAFTRKFNPDGTLTFPEIVAQKPWVFDWLSRGLREGLENFLASAKDSSYQLRGSLYEFTYEPIIEKIKAAATRGADVKFTVHAKFDDKEVKQKQGLEAIISKKGLTDNAIFRRNTGAISHNKFFILLKKNVPIAVWTGSTNLTNGGIHGHSNVGHLIKDKNIAQKYLDYWTELSTDAPIKEVRANDIVITPDPALTDFPAKNKSDVYFSPRAQLSVLEWYFKMLETKATPSFMTFPFGIDKRLEPVLRDSQRNYPMYIITDKEEKQSKTEQANNTGLNKQIIADATPFNQYAHGGILTNPNTFENWVKKEYLTGLNGMVNYIHTKYILLDPISEDPIVITGSANFSDNSIQKNDENSLVIRGEKRVADIYFSEFMRLFRHFYLRSVINDVEQNNNPNRIFLHEDTLWAKDYYLIGTFKQAMRVYFSGGGVDVV
ncbi:MAG: hypothetical protein RLZZ292_3411 [Bacteroidota bacterium]